MPRVMRLLLLQSPVIEEIDLNLAPHLDSEEQGGKVSMRKYKAKTKHLKEEPAKEICNFDLESYQEIIESLLRWKVIPLNLLKESIEYQGWDSSFRKTILKLEKRNLIRSFKIRGRAKFIYPTSQLIEIKAHRVNYCIYEAALKHEGVVTITCHKFLEWEVVKEVILPHERNQQSFNRNELEPDAILKLEKEGSRSTIGLEVELSRKSKERVQRKMSDYVNSIFYDCVIYVMNNEADFEAYKRILHHLANDNTRAERKKEILGKVMLVYKRDFLARKFSFDDSLALWRDEITTLDKIFGEKRLKNIDGTGGELTGNNGSLVENEESSTSRNSS